VSIPSTLSALATEIQQIQAQADEIVAQREREAAEQAARPTFRKNIHTNDVIYRVEVPYATEDELLTFANQVRESGGGDQVSALMPSLPNMPNTCLIANALNFQSTVIGASKAWMVNSYGEQQDLVRNTVGAPIGDFPWGMYFGRSPEGNSLRESVVEGLRERGVYVKRIYADTDGHGILLPRLIGNAAQAFDLGEGWTAKYNKDIIAASATAL
jgi:hypothetical protein